MVQSEPLITKGPEPEDLRWLDESGWNVVPRRLEVLHASWMFVWASAGLLAEFILIKNGYLGPQPDGESDAEFFRKINLVNAVGLVSCIYWVHGFFCLVHWLVSIDASKLAILGGLTKFVASCFFTVQPLGALCGYGTNSAGMDWSNLVGICFFHSGNMMSLFDMVVPGMNKPGGLNTSNLFSWGNLTVLGMFFYTLGSGLLVPPNSWVYEGTKGSNGYHPSYSASDDKVHLFQISGSTGLLIGSLIFCHWSGWLPRFGKRSAKLENDYWWTVEATS